jgi:hypothetical protein
MITEIALWLFIAAIFANLYALVRFYQAMRAFTKSQEEFNELLKRARGRDAPVR